jgi:hypothetical protein
MDAARIVALRPEEAVISVLERWLDPKTFRRFFRAFLRLLAVNRKLPAPAAWLAGFVSVDRIRTAAERQDRLWERTGYTAIDALQEKCRLPHGRTSSSSATLTCSTGPCSNAPTAMDCT